MKNKYGHKSMLLFTDIGSLVYEIETKIVSDDFTKNKELFGFSNYFAESKFTMV